LTLVAAQGHYSPVPESKLVRVAVAPDSVTAGMWQEALRRVGLPAVVRNRDALSVAWSAMASSFSCELMVSATDLEAAKLVLDDLGAPVED
jgi:hypothetical protein